MENLPPILYAEDDENDIELTLTAFKQCNLQNPIEIVRNGVEVIDYLKYDGKFTSRKNENPIVILLDIKMPKMDGIQVLKTIKSDENLKNIPIVMLTSSNMESDLLQTYNLGVNAYVVKPVDFFEFIEVVKRIGFFWALVNKTI